MSTPLRFKELFLKNFMSFGNCMTGIDLSDYGSTLITGENVDTNSANGAGKCVTGDTLINIKCKDTGLVSTISIREFYELTQNIRTEN